MKIISKTKMRDWASVLGCLLVGCAQQSPSQSTTFSASSKLPVLFGGLIGEVSLDGSTLQTTINPVTQTDQCPANYQSTFVFGTAKSGTFPGDNPVQVCTRQAVEGDVPLAVFGGMFGEGSDDQGHIVQYPNPLTGNNSCPAQFQKQEILNTGYVDWDLWYCYQLSSPTDTLSNYVSFGGLFGATTKNGQRSFYNNPVTQSSTCPSYAPNPIQVFGAINVDNVFYFCSSSQSSTPSDPAASTATYNISVPIEVGPQNNSLPFSASGTCANFGSSVEVFAQTITTTFNPSATYMAECSNGSWTMPLNLNSPPNGYTDIVGITFWLEDTANNQELSGTTLTRSIALYTPTAFQVSRPVAGLQSSGTLQASGSCDSNTSVSLSFVGNALTPTPATAILASCMNSTWQMSLNFKTPSLGQEVINLVFAEVSQSAGNPVIPDAAQVNIPLVFGSLPPAMSVISPATDGKKTIGPAPQITLACTKGMMVTANASATSLTAAQSLPAKKCGSTGKVTFDFKFHQSNVAELVDFTAYEEGDALQTPAEQNLQPLSFSYTLRKKA